MADLLRETFEAYAERAPRGDRLRDAVAARVTARRARRRWVAVGAVAATVAAVVAGVAFLPRRHEPPAPPASPVVPAGMRAVAYHGLEAFVPADWPTNAERCGTPLRDTVMYPFDSGDCAEPLRPGLTVASFRKSGSFARHPEWRAEPFEVDGHAALRATTTTFAGVPMVVVDVADVGASFAAYSPDVARARAIVDTLHVVEVDSHGCAARLASTSPTAPPARDDARTTLAPPGAVGAAVCSYDQERWLRRSEPADATLAGELAAAMDEAEPGFSAPRNEYSCLPSNRAHRAPFVVRFRYASGPGVDVWVNVVACEETGSSNGAVTGQLTERLSEALLDTAGERSVT